VGNKGYGSFSLRNKVITLLSFLIMNTSYSQQWDWAVHIPGTSVCMDEDNGGNVYTLADRSILIKMDSIGNIQWQKTFPGTAGNVKVGTNRFFVSGHFHNSFSIENITLTITGNEYYDGFLACYDLNGNLQWVKQIIDTAGTTIGSLCVKSNEEGFFCGRHGAIAFVAEFDSTGLITNDFNIIGSQSEAIVVDPFDNIYIKGTCKASTLTVGNMTKANPNTYYGSYYLSKVNKSGITDYLNWPADCYRDYITLPAISKAGEVYFVKGTNYSGCTLSKYDPVGGTSWSKPIASIMYSDVTHLNANKHGEICLTGVGWSEGVFGTCTLSANGYFPFFSKLDSLGNCKWVLTGQANCGSNFVLSSVKNKPLILGHLDDTTTIQLNSIKTTGNYFLARVNENAFVGLPELEKDQSAKLFPNPSTGKFRIQNTEIISLLRVRNSLGEIVYEKKELSAGVEIDLTQQASGIYFLEMHTGNDRNIRKIVLN
jgi:hypothetical protein